MAIEIVDFPIKHGDCPQLCKRLPEGKCKITIISKRWCFHGLPKSIEEYTTKSIGDSDKQ